jgi:hypothetical protein
MKHLVTAAVMALGVLAFGATSASAAVVCNDEGDCWKVKKKETYPPDARVNVYEDDYVVDTKKYKWREEGPPPGYWRGGVWVPF